MNVFALKTSTILGKTIASLRIGTITVSLDQTATIPVTLHTSAEEENVSFAETVTLTGAEYSAWGTDDGYVVKIVCRKLGLVLA